MGGLHPLPCRVEVPRKNHSFVDAWIGEEPVRRFDIGPVLAGEGDGLAQLTRQLPGEPTEPLPQPLIGKGRTLHLLLQPSLSGHAAVDGLGRGLPTQFYPFLFWHLSRILYLKLPQATSQKMWVIERFV